MLKLRSRGRGVRYSPWRGLAESVQTFAYALAWPARLLAMWPRACRPAVVRHRLPFLPAGRGARSLRIAFASDLHIGPLTPGRLLENAFAALAEARPDVLLLGGDYVSYDADADKAATLRRLVDLVPAPTKLAVLGNHDLWTRHERLERALEAGGVRLLINDAVPLPSPWDDVAVVGLDDPWSGQPDVQRAFAGAAAPVKLVLCHAPECYPHLAGRGVSLALCGHTHGGQVALPSGAIVVPGRVGRLHPAGLYHLPHTTLFVSRGLGFSDLPLRTFAPPDVAVIELTTPSN